MKGSPPAVKICGVTRVEDAERAVELGAVLLGLNFHPPSPRFLEIDRARRIADRVRGRAELVGVFVNRPLAEVLEIGDRVGLDLYQFHGDESADEIEPVAERAIKAFRLGDDWTGTEPAAFDHVWGFLLEGRHPELYGGSGESWRYERVADVRIGKRCLVAGGIRPETARRAWRQSGAWGLDVCSGVESSPGIKDHGRMERLFAELLMADGG